MFHADNQIFHDALKYSIHEVNLVTNISKVWEGSKPGSANIKKDSTHIFVGWNLFPTIENGVILMLPKKIAPWQHHYGVELPLVRLTVQSTQSHSQPCLKSNKSFCFSSPQTVKPSWLVICLSQSRFTRDWLRGSRTATSTITRQTLSNPFLWQGAKISHHSGYALYKFQYYLGSNFTHTAALERLCCSNTTWKRGGLCMAADTIPRTTVQPESRGNNKKICLKFSHLNLFFICTSLTVNLFWVFFKCFNLLRKVFLQMDW